MLETLISLGALLFMEIVLGIDNIIFIAILVGHLPKEERAKARTIGLALAMFVRIALLFAISWVMGLTAPLFKVFEYEVSGRDLILLLGGLFLIAKATHEIVEKMEPTDESVTQKEIKQSFSWIIGQILLLDIVFSLDSVITAVGMVKEVWIMITAVVIAMGVMIAFSGYISRLIENYPSLKILSLSFLILIGVLLTAEGMGQHINKGYIYFAMAFSLTVEVINLRIRSNRIKVDGEKESIRLT